MKLLKFSFSILFCIALVQTGVSQTKTVSMKTVKMEIPTDWTEVKAEKWEAFFTLPSKGVGVPNAIELGVRAVSGSEVPGNIFAAASRVMENYLPYLDAQDRSALFEMEPGVFEGCVPVSFIEYEWEEGNTHESHLWVGVFKTGKKLVFITVDEYYPKGSRIHEALIETVLGTVCPK